MKESNQKNSAREMSKLFRVIFLIILLFSLYHFLRDILQTFDLHSPLTDIAHRPHEWCGQYCDIVTWPLDVAGIAIPLIVLKRNKVGILGVLLLAIVLLWLIFSLLP